jgi:hypothetical protein
MAEIGSTLREARMRARIDITEVETRTKIRAKYLRALENEEWDLLPGPIYVKSFLRTYGDYLGLDSRLLIDDFKRRFERPSDGELRPIAALHRERERAARGPLVPPWAVIAGVLVAVVLVLAIIGSLANNSHTTTTSGVKPPTRHHAAGHRAHPAPAHRAPSTVRLTLRPTGQVYICLVDATGRRLINQQTFAAGQPIAAQTAPKLLLTLGNTSVQVRSNGRLIPLRASSQAIRLLLTPSGQRPIALNAAPTCP